LKCSPFWAPTEGVRESRSFWFFFFFFFFFLFEGPPGAKNAAPLFPRWKLKWFFFKTFSKKPPWHPPGNPKKFFCFSKGLFSQGPRTPPGGKKPPPEPSQKKNQGAPPPNGIKKHSPPGGKNKEIKIKVRLFFGPTKSSHPFRGFVLAGKVLQTKTSFFFAQAGPPLF